MTQEAWDAIGERIKARQQASLDSAPTVCPSCGAAKPIPTFDPIDRYECPRCAHAWDVERVVKEAAS